MPFADLREYLNALEKAGELARVKKEVDRKFELGAICKTITKRAGRRCYRSEGLALPPDETWQQVRKNWDSYFVE